MKICGGGEAVFGQVFFFFFFHSIIKLIIYVDWQNGWEFVGKGRF